VINASVVSPRNFTPYENLLRVTAVLGLSRGIACLQRVYESLEDSKIKPRKIPTMSSQVIFARLAVAMRKAVKRKADGKAGLEARTNIKEYLANLHPIS
jgi:hypothetical protein